MGVFFCCSKGKRQRLNIIISHLFWNKVGFDSYKCNSINPLVLLFFLYFISSKFINSFFLTQYIYIYIYINGLFHLLSTASSGIFNTVYELRLNYYIFEEYLTALGLI